MNENEQMPEFRSPLRRTMVMASLTSLVSAIIFYGAVSGVVSELDVWWKELLAYATVPVFLTYFILYRSCWRREITGTARTCSLLLLSCVIFVGDIVAVILAVGVMVCLAVVFIGMIAFGFNAFTGGNH
jgi:hypothetical protein